MQTRRQIDPFFFIDGIMPCCFFDGGSHAILIKGSVGESLYVRQKKLFFSLGLDVGSNNLRDIVALVALLESHLRRRSCDPEYICRTK
jgi:hypothetical protein